MFYMSDKLSSKSKPPEIPSDFEMKREVPKVQDIEFLKILLMLKGQKAVIVHNLHEKRCRFSRR